MDASCYPHPCADGIDFRILELMYSGLSDSAIGRKMSLGLRTVQRRVRGMMERTGSPSRFVFGITICHVGALREEYMRPLRAGRSIGARAGAAAVEPYAVVRAAPPVPGAEAPRETERRARQANT